MKPQLKIATSGSLPQRSPERETLATFIAKRAELVERIAAIQKAEYALLEKRIDMTRQLEAAEANVESAKKGAGRYLTDQALGRSGPAPLSVKSARAALQELADDLLALAEEREGLEVEQKDTAQRLVGVKADIRDAVRAVIAADPVTSDMLTRCDFVRREVAELTEVLGFLLGNAALPMGSRFTSVPPTYETFAVFEKWRDCFRSLENDPDAPLPAMS